MKERPNAIVMYGGAAAASAAAFLLSFAFRTHLQNVLFIFYFAALFAVIFPWGFRPGIVVIATAVLTSHFLVLDPSAVPPSNSAAFVRNFFFVLIAGGACHLAERSLAARTQARAALERLRENEDRLSRVLGNIKEGFVIMDREWRYVYLNAAAGAMINLDPKETVGKVFWELFPTLVGSPVEASFREAMATQKLVTFTNYYGPLEVWFECRCHPSPDNLAVFFQDVTARKKTEERLTLQTEQLTRSNQELEQFAYVSSHDLKEPLRKVATYAEMLGERYKGKIDAEADRYLTVIRGGIDRMFQLIDDLLAYSRVGKQNLEPEDVPLAAIVRSVTADMDDVIEATGTKVLIPEPLPIVRGNRSQVARLFQNLIANAVKFRRDVPPEITIKASDQGSEWRVEVADNGIGFEKRHSEIIFQVFQRLHTKDAYPGTGIGLAICKRIVERHGGRIYAEGIPGQGARFIFTLKKAPEAWPPPLAPLPPR